MDKKITCPRCGSIFIKSNLKRHTKTKKCLSNNKINSKLNKEQKKQDLIDATRIYLNYFNILPN